MNPYDSFNELLRGQTPQNLSLAEEELILSWTREHHVAGLLFEVKNCFKNQALRDYIEETYLLSRQRNLIFLQEYKSIAALCRKKGLPLPGALKGLALINNVYQLGERQLTDMDLYCQERDMPSFQHVLQECGYKPVPEKTWRANRHKALFKKVFAGLEITLETHGKLFYQEPADFIWKWREDEGVKVLIDDHLILHLVGHLAHQHTFLKLFWLVDIHRVLRDRDEPLPLRLGLDANRLRLNNSLLFTLHCLNQFFKTGVRLEGYDHFTRRARIVNWNFLVEPDKHRLRYLAIKHLLKDSLRENIEYDGRWLLHGLQKRAGRLIRTKDQP